MVAAVSVSRRKHCGQYLLLQAVVAISMVTGFESVIVLHSVLTVCVAIVVIFMTIGASALHVIIPFPEQTHVVAESPLPMGFIKYSRVPSLKKAGRGPVL